MLTRAFFAFGLLSLLVVPAPAQDAAAEYTPETMLAALRERDPEVDNYRMRFTRRETKRVDERAEFAKSAFRTQKFGGTPDPAPASFPDPYDAIVVSNQDCAYRGESLVLRGTYLTDHHGHPQIPRIYHYVEAGRDSRELGGTTGERHLTLRQRDNGVPSINQEYRMFYELALGVGFGRRIKTVESVEKSDDGWRVTGTFQLWTEDHTTFELATDSQLFVRRAQLRANVQGNETAFDFTNSGLIEADGRQAFAKHGTVKRINVAFTPPGGERREFGTVQHDYALEVGRIDFDLTDEQYAELSAIDAAQADYVIDEQPKN